MDRPSKVAVPRPISSRMTSERSLAWLRIAAVSTISTMKVERPRARSSEAPTRREQPVDDADMGAASPARRSRSARGWRSARSGAGRSTCRPCWGRSAARSRRPARRSRAERSQSLATKARPSLRRSACSTTDGGRPRSQKARLSSTTRPRPVLARSASSASAAETSSTASACARRADRVGMRHGLAGQRVEDAELERQRPVGGVGDLGFEVGQLGRGEAHGARHGLAMDEAAPWRSRCRSSPRRGWRSPR